MEPWLGIDFGTTYSAMAWCDPKNGRAEILWNAEGELKTPSAVYFGASEVVVGKPALHMLKDDPEEGRRVVLSCKRYLQSNAVRALPGRRVTMVETAAAILAKLKRDAEELHFHAPVRRAVVTCPAAFGELERERIEQAAQQAGFAEVKLLEEPVAAALAYARHGLQVGQHILVYDLGGGTFDLAVLLREGESGFRLALEPRGLAACGGDDFDRALYDYLDERLRTALNLTEAAEFDLNRLMLCRDCKESLSQMSSSLFRDYVGGRPFKERVERQTFENLIRDRLEDTIRLTQDLLADAARRGQPVDTVVLIGGSARIPQVAARLAQVLPVPPHKWQQQDVAVALGAAWWAEQTATSVEHLAVIAAAVEATVTTPEMTTTPLPMMVCVTADGRGDYRTLEQALAAVPDDSTIRLQPGEYRLDAPLLIEKSVRLLGAGMYDTFIVGDGHGCVLQFNGVGHFEVQGITFRHEGTVPATVMFINNGELEMSRCHMTGGKCDSESNYGDGLVIDSTCQSHISHCRMEKNDRFGIFLVNQAQPILEENTCQENGHSGIVYDMNAGGVARKNRCYNNMIGIGI